jgi:hypothetical protein
MTTPRKRGAKSATPNLDHLRNVPTPLHAGQGADWMPADAIRAKAAANGAPADAPAIGAAIKASDAAWFQYRQALKTADLERNGAVGLVTDAERKRRDDERAHVYNRARLGAWTAALGADGLHQWALKISESALSRAVKKRTKGAITIDLLPDLPARCDLTDAAVDAAKALQVGDYWPRLDKDIKTAAEACAAEALDDMGWTDSMAD